MRQALTPAINKPAIIDAIFHGTGSVAKNLLPPDVWSSDSGLKDYPRDPQQAKRLLQQAGVKPGTTIDLWAMPVQRPYNPNARRMAEMIRRTGPPSASRRASSAMSGAST